MLNPNRDLDGLGAVNAALGGDFTASALYGLGNGSRRGGNGVSQRGGNGVASIAEELSVSLSIGVSSRSGASKGSHADKGENLGCLLSADCF